MSDNSLHTSGLICGCMAYEDSAKHHEPSCPQLRSDVPWETASLTDFHPRTSPTVSLSRVYDRLVEEREVIDEALTSSERLDSTAESGDHSKTTVLNLSLAKALGLVGALGTEPKGVESSTRVQALLEVGLGVTVDLGTTHEENLEEG
mmetsp:Transcript_5002/g.7596  ORF Transcript_5002/g.7596 Transcript_5002/m.7596 type:complete len:148 (+) Transcript_5002:42-485(+)